MPKKYLDDYYTPFRDQTGPTSKLNACSTDGGKNYSISTDKEVSESSPISNWQRKMTFLISRR